MACQNKFACWDVSSRPCFNQSRYLMRAWKGRDISSTSSLIHPHLEIIVIPLSWCNKISPPVTMTLSWFKMLTEVEPFLTIVSFLLVLSRVILIMHLCCRVLGFGMKEGTLVTSWAFLAHGVLHNPIHSQICGILLVMWTGSMGLGKITYISCFIRSFSMEVL